MFINDEVIRDVPLADKEKQLAKAFIKEAVYSWLNNQGEKAFSVRTLFGGDNGDWTGTPLQSIWKRHKDLKKMMMKHMNSLQKMLVGYLKLC